jgi:hypothetical protein
MEFRSPIADVPATGVFHLNANPMASPVCELDCRFEIQTLATQVLHLDCHTGYQRLATRIIRFDCRNPAPGSLHLNHHFVERAHARAPALPTRIRLKQCGQQEMLNNEHRVFSRAGNRARRKRTGHGTVGTDGNARC